MSNDMERARNALVDKIIRSYTLDEKNFENAQKYRAEIKELIANNHATMIDIFLQSKGIQISGENIRILENETKH